MASHRGVAVPKYSSKRDDEGAEEVTYQSHEYHGVTVYDMTCDGRVFVAQSPLRRILGMAKTAPIVSNDFAPVDVKYVYLCDTSKSGSPTMAHAFKDLEGMYEALSGSRSAKSRDRADVLRDMYPEVFGGEPGQGPVDDEPAAQGPADDGLMEAVERLIAAVNANTETMLELAAAIDAMRPDEEATE